jgi:glycine/D-amino acid oxidase-like deaminating enzyme
VKPNLSTFAPALAPAGNLPYHPIPQFPAGSHLIIVGAGAFGGWTGLHCLRKGYKVTIVDAWGPANARSSSADETRVIRSTYGENEIYFDLNVRSISLWKENEKLFQRKLFHNTGVLWLCYYAHTPIVDDSLPFAEKHNMPYTYVSADELRKRYSEINVTDLHHAWLDPFGGYLLARDATRAVWQAFMEAGGNFIRNHVRGPVDPTVEGILLADGKQLVADGYIYACGAWLGDLFPTLLRDRFACTRQEVYYFGPPADRGQALEELPVWVDVDGHDFYYGIPGNAHRGFKVGVDLRGQLFDPGLGDHTVNPDVLQSARRFVEHRFPAMKGAPLLENRVCPYESSWDGNFIFDRCPGSENVILLGGGSGHGFKHGPALGELVANVLAGECQAPALFSLGRKAGQP